MGKGKNGGIAGAGRRKKTRLHIPWKAFPGRDVVVFVPMSVLRPKGYVCLVGWQDPGHVVCASVHMCHALPHGTSVSTTLVPITVSSGAT